MGASVITATLEYRELHETTVRIAIVSRDPKIITYAFGQLGTDASQPVIQIIVQPVTRLSFVQSVTTSPPVTTTL